MKNFYYEQEINVPVDSIDMYKWLRELTDIEYQSFSKGHQAMGHLNEGKFGGMINVEIVGGLLLVQHYSIKDKSKSHVNSYSDQSRAYLMGIIPVKVEVSWSQSVVGVYITANYHGEGSGQHASKISDIYFDNISFNEAEDYGIALEGYQSEKVKDIYLSNISIKKAKNPISLLNTKNIIIEEVVIGNLAGVPSSIE